MNLRITVAPQVAEDFDGLCDHKRISKQDAVDGLLKWVLAQDEIVQSMVLGQIPASPDLVELVVRRLGDRQSAPASRLPADGARAPRTGGRPNRGGGA